MIPTRSLSIAALTLVTALLWAPTPGSLNPGSENANAVISLGDNLQKVLDTLGVPSGIQADSQGVAALTYADPSTDTNEPTLRVNSGIVIWIHPKATLKSQGTPRPAEGAYLGQSVQQLVQRLGQPSKFSAGLQLVSVEYADGLSVSLANGRVVGITKRR